MHNDIFQNFQQVSNTFKELFQSQTARAKNDEYVDRLCAQVKRWHSEPNDLMTKIIEEKISQIKQLYEQYCREMNVKYERLKEQIQNNPSLTDVNDQLEEFNVYCQSNTIEKRLRLHVIPFTRDQLADKVQLEYVPYGDVRTETTITPLKPIVWSVSGSYSSSRSSSVVSLDPVTTNRKPIQNNFPQDNTQDEFVLEVLFEPSDGEPSVSIMQPTTIMTNYGSTNGRTRLYARRQDVLTPVLIDKHREVSSKNEQVAEYLIDSISLSHDQQQQQRPADTHTNHNDNNKLVRAYKALVDEENGYRQESTVPYDHRKDEESNPTNVLNLQHLNRINYSTIMFQKCQTEYNCIASSTKRNELIVYNSQLKVLIILQHENQQQGCQRLYVQWSDKFSPHISDITYCRDNDQYLISSFDTRHIYFFDRKTLSIFDLGSLADDSQLRLRRIHCHQRTVYCILSDNYLLEFQLDEQYPRLKFIQRIMLFDPRNRSQDTAYHLLDITCDNHYLIIIYADDDNIIHLQSIHRQTGQFHRDLTVDKNRPIHQNYIRIESSNSDGSFIYLNGSHHQLKAIDFVHDDEGKVTSGIRRQTKPTNVCFLTDGRLVILYEEPYFLSIHDSFNR